ncbi:MAG TPA: ABC transporter ATP-binding protein [Thermoanaerobaculia bacterium]|nr:ABC transporter ATP-binding protein [Thermoanaerobaculia bacterium]
MSAPLELDGVTAGYGKGRDVLADLTVAFPRGRAVALLGENGSGKSTLLKVLAGLLPPRKGSLLLEGRPLASFHRREAARRIGYLPQGFEPFFPATAGEVVLLGRTPYLGPFVTPTARDREASRRALVAMDALGLVDVDLREMSGGERQRVLLSRVLAGEPQVLLLDEPTANLDPRHRALVVAAVRRHVASGGTALFSTHEVDVAAAAADDAILLSAGRIQASGPLQETLTSATLGPLFGVAADVWRRPGAPPAVVFDLRGPSPGHG